jgi:imidazolonepropionase-like amidohydrolase
LQSSRFTSQRGFEREYLRMLDCSRLLLFLGLHALLLTPAFAQPTRTSATLFRNVNLVPMDRERVLRGRSVLVNDGRITSIARHIDPPPGAIIIDGRGTAYLVPGLADMHVHTDRKEGLAVMLAAGITTALNMGEARNSFVGRTREAVARGDIAGPRMFAALAVDGSPRYGHLVVATPEAARWAVRLAKANGYEFIKVYTNLAPDVFDAVVAEGAAAGLPVIGHNVEQVGLERQAESGQVLVAHLEEFLYGYFRKPRGAGAQDAPEPAEIERAVRFAKEAGITIGADLVTYQAIAAQWGRPEVVRTHLRNPRTALLAPDLRIDWDSSGYMKRDGDLSDRARFLARFVKALSAAGVPLIAGTDAPTIPGLFLGDALHQNLAALREAGLSPFDALSAATSQPGRFIATSGVSAEPFGMIREGYRADLLLVTGNPLDDLSHLRRPLGVMTNGRWHSESALRELLSEVAHKYSAATLAPPEEAAEDMKVGRGAAPQPSFPN